MEDRASTLFPPALLGRKRYGIFPHAKLRVLQGEGAFAIMTERVPGIYPLSMVFGSAHIYDGLPLTVN